MVLSLTVVILVSGMCTAAPAAVSAKKTTLTLVHYWEAAWPEHKGFVKAAAAYQKKNPDVTVKIIPSMTDEKMLTMMAGGKAPDIAITNQFVSSWAVRGVLSPLDRYMKASRVSKDDFWAASWKECEWEGKAYALPWFTDPNFTMWYNKNVFRETGLPDHGPANMSEFEVINQKVTQKDANGRLKRIGMVPYDVYGTANTVYTWGWVFGGSFYDVRSKRVTADDPKIVKAVTWLRDFTATIGGKGAIGGLLYGFATGKEAMRPWGPWELDSWGAKLKFDLGMSPMPRAEGVLEPSEWVGGQKIGIPKGIKDPQAAWDFIRFLAASKEGTDVYCSEADKRFVSFKDSSSYARFRKDSKMLPYVHLLEAAVHQRPVMPANETLDKELGNVMSLVLDKGKEPAAVLRSVTDVTQKQLDRTLDRFGKK